ncbi:hypothetical protein bmyco0001_42080 [Bacillus mycoides DSM 2048]|nr:hypothetical protein bmyco0001_42080 [Bacillus mycoides DSM 2048]
MRIRGDIHAHAFHVSNGQKEGNIAINLHERAFCLPKE